MLQAKITDYYPSEFKSADYFNSWYKYFFKDSKNTNKHSNSSLKTQSVMTDYYNMIDRV